MIDEDTTLTAIRGIEAVALTLLTGDCVTQLHGCRDAITAINRARESLRALAAALTTAHPLYPLPRAASSPPGATCQHVHL